MFVYFPNQDTLQLALTSGVIPEQMSLAPAKAHFGEDGSVWVHPKGTITRSAATELDRLGVKLYKRVSVPMDQQVLCWPQLVPIVQRLKSPDVGQQTPVLFELFDDEQLPELISELLRQGNDRLAFRHLSNGVAAKSLLRVVGPPYYSLLRALDRNRTEEQPRAYVEQSARVWVELGYEHPLAAKIKPAPGKWLLLRPPHEWDFVDEGRFRDVYETLEFPLPSLPTNWSESNFTRRISVPLRLTTTSAKEPAELWVLRDGAIEQIEKFVSSADDQLVSQLAFAVAGSDDQPMIILRARPSRKAPPVLILDGIGFRPYLKLPNLFLPVASRLHPPLRRDAVARLFQQDPMRVTWLCPDDSGAFTPQSIGEDAFRPLSDWVDYVIDRNQESLATWVASYRFKFESFVCTDDKPAIPSKPPQEPKPTKRPTNVQSGQVKRSGRENDEPEKLPALLEIDGKKPEPSQLQLRLRKLETQYLASESPFDADDRSRLWREMAAVNGMLRHRHDATVCWSNGLWEESAPSAALLDAWLSSEDDDASSTGVALDDLLIWIDDPTTPVNASKVSAYLVRSALLDAPPPKLIEQLGSVIRYLEAQESNLPVRTAWLAWLAVVRLSHGDVLALARARDRLLERLYQHGLRSEFDLPTFLRASGSGDADRFRVLREHVRNLHEVIYDWINEPPSGGTARTKAYADLLFAFALARLGETSECRRLTTRAEEALAGSDPVHRWLRTAFSGRIKQAQDGNSFQEPLDRSLMERLASVDRMDRYKIDRLRQHSYILEPHERIDPYRRWHRRYEDDLRRQLAELHDVTNRDELRSRVSDLVRQTAKNKTAAVRVLNASLELAPRLGEAAARELLDRVDPTLTVTGEMVERALLLTRGMLIAAHYGAIDHVHTFVGQFQKLLSPIVTTFLTVGREHHPEDADQIDSLEDLFSSSFHGLRRLGMRDEVGRLFSQIADIIEKQIHANRSKGKGGGVDSEKVRLRARRLLLTVAGGWFYFGQIEQAKHIIEDVRAALFEGKSKSVEQKNLACSYVAAVGQAPLETALPLILELFETGTGGRRKLPGIEDAMTTSTHFSISQLDLVEAVVMALVSDDFSLNAESRRWTDEDEFLVRRRIHRDVREAMK